MKTEPTEALRLIKHNSSEESYWGEMLITTDDAEYAVNVAFQEGQSNPKIKQLEWVEVWDGYEDVKTPFGHYVVRPSVDNKTFLMRALRKGVEPYLTLSEAKAAAQADFEKRIKECLE